MNSTGTLFYVVGPSGVGKDSLIDGLRERLDSGRFAFARRIITRHADSVGEDHESCTEEAFVRREESGDFLLTWQAHGLRYGLAASLKDELAAGRHVIANGSRAATAELAHRIERLVVIEIDAPAELIASRLTARGRESPDDVARRMARKPAGYPAGVKVLRIINDRDLHTGTLRLQAAIHAQLEPERESSTAFGLCLRKLSGARLNDAEWSALLGAVVAKLIDGPDLRALLIACASELDDAELVSVARWRASLMPRLDWGRTPVVDKHSLGGTAGSRVTMVVIPIVAAHGLLIPKTSSRAITSAAGTADAMEVLARVDLTALEMREVVAQAGACIAWNGKLNHSILDEAMHQVERELALDTRRWSVASILSKKWSAGATHVVIDVPYMPRGKVATLEEAREVAALFERIGEQMGLVVRAFPSDGSAPIGRGIGPALEARDVLRVLDNHPDAPEDLREKSLFFAGQILALDPGVASVEQGLQRAQQLLADGSARRAFEAIIDAQGRQPDTDGSSLERVRVNADRSGRVAAIDARRISMIARAAGAPADPLAGVDLACRVGDRVSQGELLYCVQGRSLERRDKALSLAHEISGVLISDGA